MIEKVLLKQKPIEADTHLGLACGLVVMRVYNHRIFHSTLRIALGEEP